MSATSLRLLATAAPEGERFASLRDATDVRARIPALSALAPYAAELAGAATALEALAGGSGTVWPTLDRGRIVEEVRHRLADPMIIDQHPTHLCGPLSIVMELVRRRPKVYVEVVKELLETGKGTFPGGYVIEAEDDLRGQPCPGGPIGHVDWLLAATMRDFENESLDIADGEGYEALTLWDGMSQWTGGILGLNSPAEGVEGMLAIISKAQEAVEAGGVAFLLVDKYVLEHGPTDDEEQVWFTRTRHRAGERPAQPVGPLHSKDDGLYPDHWVVFLSGQALGPGDDDQVVVRVWSWGARYELTGPASSLNEYLYKVVTGRP